MKAAASGWQLILPQRCRISAGSKALKLRGGALEVSASKAASQQQEGSRARESPKALSEGKALKVKPHERDRHEIRSEGSGGRKPSGE